MAFDKFFPQWVSCPTDQVLWCSSFWSMVEQVENRPATTTTTTTPKPLVPNKMRPATDGKYVDMDWELVDKCQPATTTTATITTKPLVPNKNIPATDGKYVDMDWELVDKRVVKLPPDPFEMDVFDRAELLPHDPFDMGIQMSATISGLVYCLPHLVPATSSPLISDDDASDASSEMDVPSSPAPVTTAAQIPEGMVYALGHLGVKDLLSVEQVCKSLYEAVRGDPLLWMSIQIDSTLSKNINDDTLLKVTRIAKGNLRALTLVSCLDVTDEGLKCVLEENPLLTKLSVPGCWKLTLDGLVTNLKSFNSRNYPGIKHLKLGRLFGISDRHFNELTTLLSADTCHTSPQRKPHLYHVARSSMTCSEDRAFDIEVCPLCQKYLLVYDCPLESCKEKRDPCRACESCILRCMTCGKCIRDDTYTETFSLEYLCDSCFQLSSVE